MDKEGLLWLTVSEVSVHCFWAKGEITYNDNSLWNNCSPHYWDVFLYFSYILWYWGSNLGQA